MLGLGLLLVLGLMQDADGSVPFSFGTDSEGDLVFSDDEEIVKKACGKSIAPFPTGILMQMQMQIYVDWFTHFFWNMDRVMENMCDNSPFYVIVLE